MTALGEAAAIILLLELLIVLLIFVAIAGGMAFGLRWVNGKTEWAFGKANGWVEVGQRYLHKGTDLAVTPLIMSFALADRILGTAESLRRQVHELQARRTESIEVAARPVLPEPEEETEAVVPLV